jgi:hypothetical protein
LDPEAFRQGFLSWTQDLHTKTAGQIIAADSKMLRRGKMLRHSFDAASSKGLFTWSWMGQGASGLVRGQVKVDDKSHKIMARPLLPLLLKMLGLPIPVVTADAAGCQKTITAQVQEQKGDYVRALKIISRIECSGDCSTC